MSKVEKDFFKHYSQENGELAQIIDFEPREEGFYTQEEIDRIIRNVKSLEEEMQGERYRKTGSLTRNESIYTSFSLWTIRDRNDWHRRAF